VDKYDKSFIADVRDRYRCPQDTGEIGQRSPAPCGDKCRAIQASV
jgi:hypothetical protein